MAATRIMSIHIGKNKTARQCVTERLDYIMFVTVHAYAARRPGFLLRKKS